MKNNGGKIKEELIDKIFEKKFSTKAKPYGERGYGLFIVKELISRYNGKISVKSTDEDTEFLIQLKLKNMSKTLDDVKHKQ